MFKKIALIFVTLFLFSNCVKKTVNVVQAVTQENANNILLILENNNVPAEKVMDPKDGLFSITVEKKNQRLALQILSNYGEPVAKHQTLGQIFKKEGMISSPMEEYARYTDALNQELESTLAQLDGVISVRVQVSLPMPSDNLWSSEAVKPGAAIFIKYRPGYKIDQLSNRIKMLASKAVPGLTPEMVEVMPYQKKDDGRN